MAKDEEEHFMTGIYLGLGIVAAAGLSYVAWRYVLSDDQKRQVVRAVEDGTRKAKRLAEDAGHRSAQVARSAAAKGAEAARGAAHSAAESAKDAVTGMRR